MKNIKNTKNIENIGQGRGVGKTPLATWSLIRLQTPYNVAADRLPLLLARLASSAVETVSFETQTES